MQPAQTPPHTTWAQLATQHQVYGVRAGGLLLSPWEHAMQISSGCQITASATASKNLCLSLALSP